MIDSGWVPLDTDTVISDRSTMMLLGSVVVLILVILVNVATSLGKPSPKRTMTGLKLGAAVGVVGVLAVGIVTWFTAGPDRGVADLNSVVIDTVDAAGGYAVYREGLVVPSGTSGQKSLVYAGKSKTCRGKVEYAPGRARVELECE